MKKLTVLLMCVMCAFIAQAQKTFTLRSTDGTLSSTNTTGYKLIYNFTFNGRHILSASSNSMKFDNGYS